MIDKDTIIEKIKKLLRMKRGGTPAEIETALGMAAELARKHGIELGDVDPEDESKTERITHVEEVLGLRLPLEAKFAAGILVNFFSVQILFRTGVCRWYAKRRGSITFVGTAWDCQVAQYVFVFLQRHFRYSWTHRANKRLRNREAFLHGMFLGLAAKLEAQQPKPVVGEGLIRLDRAVQLRKDYLAKLCPDSKDQSLPGNDSDAWASKMAGAKAGRETEIRGGLNKSPTPSRPALQPPVGQLALL